MRKLLIILMLIPSFVFAGPWDTSEKTGTIDKDGLVSIKFHVLDSTSNYINTIFTRSHVMFRQSDGIGANVNIGRFNGYLSEDPDQFGTLRTNTRTSFGDSSIIGLTFSTEGTNISRYENGTTVKVRMEGWVAASRLDGYDRSGWDIIDLVMVDTYDPNYGISFSDSCGIPGVLAYLKVDNPTYVAVKWEYYDQLSLVWTPFVFTSGNDEDDFSLNPVVGPSSTNQISIAYNNFSYIGARTDGQTRITLKSPSGVIGSNIVGPDISGWCGFVPDTTPPTVTSSSGGYWTIGGGLYYATLTTNEVCLSRYRYRIDGGAWSSFSVWSSSYSTTHTYNYHSAARDKTMDFELEVKDQAELTCACNPTQITILPE